MSSLKNYSILYASFKVEDIVLFKKNIEHDSQDYATYKIMPASRRDKLFEEIKNSYDVIIIDQSFATDPRVLIQEIKALCSTPVFLLNLQGDSEKLIEAGFEDVLPGPIDFGMLMGKIKSLTGKSLTKSVPSFVTKTSCTLTASPLMSIVEISDQEVSFLSPFEFSEKSLTRLHSNGFFSWIQSSVLGKVVSCQKTPQGLYLTKVSFLNLDLETMRNLRKWIMKEYSQKRVA